MENRGLGNRQSPYFPATYSPGSQAEDFYVYPFHRNSLPVGGFDTPQAPNAFSGDQPLESAFSRLNLSSDFHPQTAPLRPPPVSVGDVAVPERGGLMGYYGSLGLREQQELNNVGLLQFDQNGGGHQGLGFGGVHRNLMVGPGNWVCGPGVSGFVDGTCRESWSVGESPRLTIDFKNDNSQLGYDNASSCLQCKQSLSRSFPNFPCSNQNGLSMANFDGLSSGLMTINSSIRRPNSNNNRQLYARNRHQLNGFSLRDMRGRIVPLAKDQNGSKILQAKLDSSNEREIEMVLSEVIYYIADLMKNQSGSYFVQKLFVVCSEEQRIRIIVTVTMNSAQLVDICLDPSGGRSMQKLLENLSTPEQISLVISALSPHAVALANDPNGQHVIKYCLINYHYEYHKHLLNEIANNCYQIATDKSGCCVLQACVENAYGEPKRRLIEEIIKNALQLAEDPYGNYVVQHLLGLKIPEVTALLLGQLQGHFVALSSDKYASNVVEKFLSESGKQRSTTIIIELLTSPNAGSLLVHPYGNFVIQKALSVAKGEVYIALRNLINNNSPSMRSNLFGRKILDWFENKKHQHYKR
ncbi:hypothetical protein ACH5RR_034922 [Cinchona calisaya]|uniref:PUM-HD domain-containing protein n=1 Tax=Cinchona calisaya TaxID=153742 RepID=A0ABD2YDN4_9GENT